MASAIGPAANPLVGQTDSTLTYHAEPLACVSFRQVVRSDLATVHGVDVRKETSGWEGDLVFRAGPDTGSSGLAITAWFEHLRVWRDTPEGRWDPAADGMLGGRYRGVLSSGGNYRAIASPFVPDAVSAIAEMGSVVEELLPPVPTIPLVPGESVGDDRGWNFDRLSDTLTSAGVAWRLRLTREDSTQVAVDRDGGLVARGESVEQERGRIVWRPGVGPLSWIRSITTTVTFSSTTASAREVRTELRQERKLEYLGPLPATRCSTP